jgi:uncharacterized glyoxalase superfamily protein PhnB
MPVDPFETLRLPIVALDPRPAFAEALYGRIRAELAPLLLHPLIDEEQETTTMTTAVTTSPVTAGVHYRDAQGGIQWLVDVLGFRVDERHDLPDGSVAHARLIWHGGQIFVSTRNPGSSPWAAAGPASIAINTPASSEVDELYERARGVGADLIADLEDTSYGSHQFGVRDPEGNLWTIGTYLPNIGLTQ